MKKRFRNELKRKAYVVVATMLGAAMLMGGCGGKTKEQQRADYYQNELGLSKSEAQELAADVQKELDKSGSDSSEGENMESGTIHYQRFPKAEGWSSLTLKDRAIQIDDVIYKAPMTMTEFIKLLESSSVAYEYEYNPDKLVGEDHCKNGVEYSVSDAREKLTVSRNGTPWFTAYCLNYTGDTIPYSDLFVAAIKPEEAAMDYCYFLDGRCIEDICTMKYNDVKNLGSTLFSGYEMLEKPYYDDTILFTFYLKADDSNCYVKNKNYVYSYSDSYSITVDTNTSQVKKTKWFELYSTINRVYTYVYDAVTEYSQLSQEDVKVLTDAGIAAYGKEDVAVGGWTKIHNYFDGAQYTPVGMCFNLSNFGKPTYFFPGIEIQYSDITVVYKVHATDGNTYYALAYFPYLQRDGEGKLIWNEYRFSLEYDNIGDLYTSLEGLAEGEYYDFSNMIRLDAE